MELLLNLLWLLLAIPAVWIWREARHAQPGFDSRRGLLLLACVVILLFPIISASDDLQAMRPEVEESASQDALRHTHHCRHAVQTEHAGCGLWLSLQPGLRQPAPQCCGQVMALVVNPSIAAVASTKAGRAPPAPLVG